LCHGAVRPARWLIGAKSGREREICGIPDDFRHPAWRGRDRKRDEYISQVIDLIEAALQNSAKNIHQP
jgi:hypothetical protein